MQLDYPAGLCWRGSLILPFTRTPARTSHALTHAWGHGGGREEASSRPHDLATRSIVSKLEDKKRRAVSLLNAARDDQVPAEDRVIRRLQERLQIWFATEVLACR